MLTALDSFHEILEKRGLKDLLEVVEWEPPKFQNYGCVEEAFLDIVEKNRSVFVYGDYDIDGLYSALTVKESLEKMGCTKVTVYNYKKRTHQLDPLAMVEIIQSLPDYVVICDTGSSEIEKLKILTSYGIKCIVLDHHNCNFGYSEFYEVFGESVAIVNTTIENDLLGRKEFELSAGALTFCVMEKVGEKLGFDLSVYSSYALVTLYSDCMRMGNRLNRSIYYRATSLEELPTNIVIFMHVNSKFFSRFVQFTLAPKVNACFRSENFDVLNRCFFNSANAVEKSACIEMINSIYSDSRENIAVISDLIKYDELENFVIADLTTVEKFYDVKANKLWNYTGLVANRISDKFKKPTIVYCKTQHFYKASFRDVAGGNYLQVFKQFCQANGHAAAFGIKISFFELNSFLKSIGRLDRNYNSKKIENSPIRLVVGRRCDARLIHQAALYNEFSGQDVPTILLEKLFTADMMGGRTNYYFLYHWDRCIIQANYALRVGSSITLQPVRNGSLRAVVIG